MKSRCGEWSSSHVKVSRLKSHRSGQSRTPHCTRNCSRRASTLFHIPKQVAIDLLLNGLSPRVAAKTLTIFVHRFFAGWLQWQRIVMQPARLPVHPVGGLA